MARFCDGCGHPLKDNDLFCDKCGKKTHVIVQGVNPMQQPVQRPVQQPAQQAQQSQYAIPPQPQKKSRTGLFVGLGIGAIAIVGLVVIVAAVLIFKPTQPTTNKGTPSGSQVELIPFPDELKIDAGKVKVNCSYQAPDIIIPANYRSLSYIVYMQCSTDRGRTKLMVTVEIPGFTQKFEQMVEVSRAETELIIHPALIDDASKSLNSSKDAQLVISVKDLNSSEIVLQDTKPIKLYSRYDMQWQDQSGTPYYENILAWVTPEAPEVDELLRLTADSCNELTNGGLNAVIGYQQNGDWAKEDITYIQAYSMMYTLAAKYNVKYIMAPFSATSADLQRIKTPAQVINTSGGLCIETAVTMASAIQGTGMHAVILLLPGHAQVAVETWRDSGEYFLIETTALEAAAAKQYEPVIPYEKHMNKEQWAQYMAQDGVVAIDCALAGQLHIQSID